MSSSIFKRKFKIPTSSSIFKRKLILYVNIILIILIKMITDNPQTSSDERNIFDILYDITQSPLHKEYKTRYPEFAQDTIFVKNLQDIIKNSNNSYSVDECVTELLKHTDGNNLTYDTKLFMLKSIQYILCNNIKGCDTIYEINKLMVELQKKIVVNAFGKKSSMVTEFNKRAKDILAELDTEQKINNCQNIFDVLFHKFGYPLVPDNTPKYIVGLLEKDENFQSEIYDIINNPNNHYLTFWTLIHTMKKYRQEGVDIYDDTKRQITMLCEYLCSNNISKENCGKEIGRYISEMHKKLYTNSYMCDRLTISTIDKKKYLTILHADTNKFQEIEISTIRNITELNNTILIGISLTNQHNIELRNTIYQDLADLLHDK
jgi:hypothetical protein